MSFQFSVEVDEGAFQLLDLDRSSRIEKVFGDDQIALVSDNAISVFCNVLQGHAAIEVNLIDSADSAQKLGLQVFGADCLFRVTNRLPLLAAPLFGSHRDADILVKPGYWVIALRVQSDLAFQFFVWSARLATAVPEFVSTSLKEQRSANSVEYDLATLAMQSLVSRQQVQTDTNFAEIKFVVAAPPTEVVSLWTEHVWLDEFWLERTVDNEEYTVSMLIAADDTLATYLRVISATNDSVELGVRWSIVSPSLDGGLIWSCETDETVIGLTMSPHGSGCECVLRLSGLSARMEAVVVRFWRTRVMKCIQIFE